MIEYPLYLASATVLPWQGDLSGQTLAISGDLGAACGLLDLMLKSAVQESGYPVTIGSSEQQCEVEDAEVEL